MSIDDVNHGIPESLQRALPLVQNRRIDLFTFVGQVEKILRKLFSLLMDI
jgi:phage terminase Nu1 subunit (DNA packaging protein)